MHAGTRKISKKKYLNLLFKKNTILVTTYRQGQEDMKDYGMFREY